MSQQDLELLSRCLEEWNRGDFSAAAIRRAFHPDVEFLPLRSATEGAYRGIAGIERFFADTQEVFDGFELHSELRDLGERLLAWGTVHVRARGSGIETDLPSGGVFDFRDGKIARWEDFGSKQKALEALGLER
jgi:ketosteroid isomerase-like protein